MKNIWRTGLIFTAAQFLTLLIGFGFQMIIRRQLGAAGEFGFVQTTIIFIGFLALPLAIAAQAVTHYIARFHFSGDDARLHGLLAGCRKFLFHISIAGSIVAILLIKPLGDFFHIPRASLTVIALVCVLATLWSSFITALCQGLGWFKRLALIGLLAAVIRLAFGVSATTISPVAEWAVLASAVMLLSNLVLLFWRKDFPRKTDMAVSPWTAEFVQFLVVSAACVFGTNCFSQYDALVAQRYFPGDQLDNYTTAGLLARQIPSLVGPLLAVLFTYRSSRHQHPGDALREQLKLLGLYAFGLITNAVGLYLLRTIGLRLIGQNTPEAAAMIAPFSVTMVFVGLLQAFGVWALASRWIKISLLYGALGLAYWLTLLFLGKSPAALLNVMPVAAGIAFGVLFLVWFIAMRTHKIDEPARS
jgi:O-antigen/teichoic acid export membrane protein